MADLCMTIVSSCLTVGLFLIEPDGYKMIAFAISSVLVFVTFIGPAWMIWAARLKNEIRGPWDEARIGG
jgi:hypothetical protein